jgi:hypothetical protein
MVVCNTAYTSLGIPVGYVPIKLQSQGMQPEEIMQLHSYDRVDACVCWLWLCLNYFCNR